MENPRRSSDTGSPTSPTRKKPPAKRPIATTRASTCAGTAGNTPATSISRTSGTRTAQTSKTPPLPPKPPVISRLPGNTPAQHSPLLLTPTRRHAGDLTVKYGPPPGKNGILSFPVAGTPPAATTGPAETGPNRQTANDGKIPRKGQPILYVDHYRAPFGRMKMGHLMADTVSRPSTGKQCN